VTVDDERMSTFKGWELFAPGVLTNSSVTQFLKVENGFPLFTVYGGRWVLASNEQVRVLEHFGLMPAKAPNTPERTSFTDKDGDMWVRGDEPGVVIWPKIHSKWRIGDHGLQVYVGGVAQWSIDEALQRPTVGACALAAIKALWPGFKPTVPEPAKPDDDQITWSFEAAQEDVDIARILREAQEKGALEVTTQIETNAPETYLHLSVAGLVEQYLRTIGGPTLFTSVGIQNWVTYHRPLLADARAWEAAQKKPKRSPKCASRASNERRPVHRMAEDQRPDGKRRAHGSARVWVTVRLRRDRRLLVVRTGLHQSRSVPRWSTLPLFVGHDAQGAAPLR
jgi:hypothetical protein